MHTHRCSKNTDTGDSEQEDRDSGRSREDQHNGHIRMNSLECNRSLSRSRQVAACSIRQSSDRNVIVLAKGQIWAIAQLSFLLHVLIVKDDQLRRVEARENQLVAIGHDIEPDHDIRHGIAETVDIVVIVVF